MQQRGTKEDSSTSRMIKRIRDEIEIDETTYEHDEDNFVSPVRSPTPKSHMRQNVREVLEMLDRVQYQVTYLRREREEARIAHEAEVERYRDRIEILEDELRYRQVIIDVISDDVDQLEEQMEGQRKHIEELMKREHHQRIARNERITLVKHLITGLADTANL
ncbi:hypothetical protein BDR06DRAFT_1015172 [Suillus hirtellus]|nr:hypothetical protein BDR06DRAFT_1015172 [Suillus hirtellus]